MNLSPLMINPYIYDKTYVKFSLLNVTKNEVYKTKTENVLRTEMPII